MKVLVFTSLYPNNVWPNHGVFIKERMTRFAKTQDCQIVVVAPVPYYPLRLGWRSAYTRVAKQEMIEGIQVYHPRYFMLPKIGMMLHGWLMYLSVLGAVKKIQKLFQFDLIDAHYIYPDGFAAALLARFFRKPLVVSARGSDVNLFSTFPIIRKLLIHVLSRAEQVIAVSKGLRGVIAELGISDKKISVIPNGVDGCKFTKIEKKKARQLLKLPQQRPILLSVGGLTETKGFDRLVRAFKIIVDPSTDNPLLVIVGEGKMRTDLEALISKLNLNSHVRLVGAIKHDELYFWYSAADVFCLASEREGWPNVILEALSCGLPVVGTAVGGIPEIIASEDLGLLTSGDPVAIASRIQDALGKTWDYEYIVRYARYFTWDRAASRLREVFNSAVSSAVADASKIGEQKL